MHLAGFGIVVERGAGGHAQRRFFDGIEPGVNFVAIDRVLKPLPAGHPVADKAGPVRPDADMRKIRVRGEIAAHRVAPGFVERGLVHVAHGVHHVADALVGGQVIEKPVMPRHGDARLLGPAAPVAHVVAGAQHGVFAAVVYVHLAAMTAHRAGKAIDGVIARAQKQQPVDIGVAKLGVLPRAPARVVQPAMPYDIVGVHDVAVIPKTVPPAPLNLVDIKMHQVFKRLFAGRVPRLAFFGGQPIGAQRFAAGVQIQNAHQKRVVLHVPGKIPDRLLARHGAIEFDGDFVCVGNAVGIIVDAAVGITVRNGVVCAKIIAFAIFAVQPRR
jgi:hypothetical protein